MKNKMSEQEEFNKIIKEIEEKLEKNPELQDKIKEYVSAIEDIFGYSIELNVVYAKGIDDYRTVLSNYLPEEMDFSNTMTLGEFKTFINDDDESLKVSIDPIYLKDGINEINNLLVTTYDDKIILVPKINVEDE